MVLLQKKTMKTKFLIILLSITSIVHAQSYKSDYFSLKHTNVPERLIYDQIKSYNFNSSSVGEYLPYDAISRNTLVLSSYKNAINADMKVQVDYGPFQIIEEKTKTNSKTEEVNGVKVTTTTYSREVTFRFPISYRATNTKNGVTIWNGQLLNTIVQYINSPEYSTEAEAVNYISKNKPTLYTNKTNDIVNDFTGNQNAYFKRSIDFYPTQTEVEMYKFKKWKQDDEYNAHVKTVVAAFSQATYDESTTLILNKIRGDIDYFNSFEGKFNPTDKSDDILYWGNYMNLASIYYALDNTEKADFYINKILDSSKKKTETTKALKSYVTSLKNKFAKHYVTDRHFTYNPVVDYRLTGKKINSDAASTSESMAGSMVSGDMIVSDYIITLENKERLGKIIVDNITGQLQFLPKEDPSKVEILSPVSILAFKKDSIEYVMQKNFSDERNPVKQFFKVVYKSKKIMLLEYVNNYLTPQEAYTGVVRPNEPGITFFAGFGLKKRVAKYFADCPEVSKKASNGDYGGAMSNKIVEKYTQMCIDYDACK